MMQGLGLHTAEVEEIRHVIYEGLLYAFKMTIQCNPELSELAKICCGDVRRPLSAVMAAQSLNLILHCST